MTGTLRLVLGDQLTRSISALDGLDPASDVVLMAELTEETGYVRHHKQKIVLILAAMRHFAADLVAEGVRVDYIRLDDPANTGGFSTELERAIARHAPDRVVMTEPGEWRIWQMMQDWQARLRIPVEIRHDTRFFCGREGFRSLAQAHKTGRMEYFYREMRRRTGILMEGDAPVGGKWNFDSENRRALPRGHPTPLRLRFAPDAATVDVINLVRHRFADHFGELEPFGWAVTRADALEALDHFLADCLPDFGDYQDAMKSGEDFLYHSVISPYLNCGLLTAAEVCAAAEAAFHRGAAPLNAVEGFIRQILGWREFVRGIYWSEMPGYADRNHLSASRDLPAVYWTGETPMRCMAECIGTTRRTGYAHHIQRLMVTGNFALLFGVAPPRLAEWYLAVYVDAFEWVELPNVLGMVLHADGGRIGSKPYAASGAYINRMSDYCGTCRFDPRRRTGPNACPFNFLYWAFLIENEHALSKNPRMMLAYGNLERLTPAERAEILRLADGFRTIEGAPGATPTEAQLRLDGGW